MTESYTLSDRQKNIAVLTMMIGSFIAVLNQTLLATALPAIMQTFHITLSTVQWVTTIFMLINGIMIPISAYFTEKFSTKQFYFTAISLFIVGSFLSMVAPNFVVLLIGRVIQAIGAGILIPLIQVVLLVAFPIDKRGKAMGIFGLVTGFSPAIGPTLSGWILSYFQWPAIFGIVLVAMLLNFVVSLFTMKNLTQVRDASLDSISVVLSSIAFGGLLYAFSTASHIGFNHFKIWFILVASLLSLYIYIFRQKQLPKPMLNFSVLKEK